MSRLQTRKKRLQRPRQLELELKVRSWGGKRDGAGRPRLPGSVSHAARPALASRFPVHVTLKLNPSLPNLRLLSQLRVVEACLRGGKEREGFRLAHYSIQPHHLHLIAEAQNASALAVGIKGLSVRIAKGLNRALARRGCVFAERYFSRILRTPRQTRAALAYVLLNRRRHDAQRGRSRDRGWLDPCSSARFFDGWHGVQPRPLPGEEPCVSAPRLWLLTTGWRLRGLIRVDDVPGEH